MNDIMVSICCITYNQEKYIREAIESFLRQKTNFKFEIVIHDDASTDDTPKIIKEYEKKYPDLIKAIYQTENQYKQGKRASLIVMKEARGKYIAMCEGDDYWIDDNKIQLQYDYMTTHDNCTFCFHNGYVKDELKPDCFVRKQLPRKKDRFQKFILKKKNDFMTNELIYFGAVPTASIFFKRDCCLNNLPTWFEKIPAGDIALRLINSHYGYAHYIDRIMSVYRINTGNSVTDSWKKDLKESYIKEINLKQQQALFYDYYNEYTNNVYKKEIEVIKNKLLLEIFIIRLLNEKEKIKLIRNYKIKVYNIDDLYIFDLIDFNI